ncbi:MAG: hypothetical protein FWF95_00785 [Syntrophorhabdaceae bacterium]|nr:hypothetical protein [Syntrophorhabdaceae bacterium]
MTRRVLAALLVTTLLVLQAGCGRKASPEPRAAFRALAAAWQDIALSR